MLRSPRSRVQTASYYCRLTLRKVRRMGCSPTSPRSAAIPSLGIILYSRANGRAAPETVERLADACPNLIAFKDGVGDMEELWAMRTALGGRLAFLNGMPTAEVYAPAYRAMGVPTYSSAVYNFAPSAAMCFFHAVQAGDATTIDAMMRAFFIPYGRLRNRQPGYAVSIVKAGVEIAGMQCRAGAATALQSDGCRTDRTRAPDHRARHIRGAATCPRRIRSASSPSRRVPKRQRVAVAKY